MYHMTKYTVGWESYGEKSPIQWEKYEYQFPRFTPYQRFGAFSHTMRNQWGNLCISHMMKHTIGWESNGKKHPYYGKSMSINFPDFPHTIGFVAFSRTVGKLWQNLYISHMLKYTTGWESNGKKHPYYGKSMSINFPDFPHTMGFVAFSHTVGTLWGNPYISHMIC